MKTEESAMSKKSRTYDDPSYDEHQADPQSPPTQPPEPDPQTRARDLLKSMTEAQRHNAPVTPLMLTELQAIVANATGEQPQAPLHQILDTNGHPDTVTFKKPDGTVEVIDSAEEALAYVRSLPADVQQRPHWVTADDKLEEAVHTVQGSDISQGIRAFKTALDADRDATPRRVDIPAKPEQPKPAPQPDDM
jgi:hypothetical protein